MAWSTVQLGIAILCSCLPTYAPLFKKAKPAIRTFTSNFQSSSTKNSSRGTRGSNTNGTSTSGTSGYYKNLGGSKGGVTSNGNGSIYTPDREDFPLKPLSASKNPISRPVLVNGGDDQIPLAPSHDSRTSLDSRVKHFAGGDRGW